MQVSLYTIYVLCIHKNYTFTCLHNALESFEAYPRVTGLFTQYVTISPELFLHHRGAGQKNYILSGYGGGGPGGQKPPPTPRLKGEIKAPPTPQKGGGEFKKKGEKGKQGEKKGKEKEKKRKRGKGKKKLYQIRRNIIIVSWVWGRKFKCYFFPFNSE